MDAEDSKREAFRHREMERGDVHSQTEPSSSVSVSQGLAFATRWSVRWYRALRAQILSPSTLPPIRRTASRIATRIRSRLFGPGPVDVSRPPPRVVHKRPTSAPGSADSLRFAIKVPATNHDVKHQWGDYHFAVALAECFRRSGHTARIDIRCDWYPCESVDDDIVVVLRGLGGYRPRAHHLNVMWNISHPDSVASDEYEAYDHVFVASEFHALALARKLTTPVSPLLQCTDPNVFYPDPDPRVPEVDLLFIGNSRKQRRTAVIDAIEAGLPLSIFGAGWEGLVDPKYVTATHVPNDRVRKHYSRAHVVLNDHWPSMREAGFLSNRLFDAAACGAGIASDPARGLRDVFGDLIFTYAHPAELAAWVTDQLRTAPGFRTKLAELVIKAHTFEDRASRIQQVVLPLARSRRRGPNPMR